MSVGLLKLFIASEKQNDKPNHGESLHHHHAAGYQSAARPVHDPEHYANGEDYGTCHE